jgi:hypothetical protein
MKISLSPPQSRAFVSTAKSIGIIAGFGSGKTELDLTRMISTMLKYPDADMLYLAPTFPLIKDIWYPKAERFFYEIGLKYGINKQDNTIQVAGMGKIFCRTMEHPSRIIGFEVLDAVLDEFDILKEEKAFEVWRKTKARCRQKVYLPGKKKKKKYRKLNQMIVSTTPEGFKASYKLFKQDPLPRSELIQMSTYSNEKNLPDDYIQELKANYPSQLIEAYLMGKFVNLVSKPVWYEYQRDLHRSFDFVKKKDSLIVGMDFNVGRGCAVVFVRRQNGLHAVDEIINTYDTPATIMVLKTRYPRNTITVYPDASGESRKSVNATISDLALLRQAGFIVKALNKNPNVKDRVTATNAQFMNGCGDINLWVNDILCPVLSDCLEQQIYDKNGMPEKGEGKGDDITDAFSYPIATLYPVKKIQTTRIHL